jgi:acyl-CoA synthetase (AMP-forming)/AMP-acid ligase II
VDSELRGGVTSESNFVPYYLSDIVSDNVRWAPAKPALIFEDRIITWAGFAIETARLRVGLAAQGVRRGSRVAIRDRNRPITSYCTARLPVWARCSYQ